MDRLFLLRAYGDFVIAIQALLKSEKRSTIKIVASLHLKPLYDAIDKEIIKLSPLNIEFVDFGIIGSQLNFFTNREFISIKTIEQLFKLKNYIKHNPNLTGIDYLENVNRKYFLELLTSNTFQYVIENKNVYKEYELFLTIEPTIISLNKLTNKRILIIPDARIKKREIPYLVIKKIKKQYEINNNSITIAYFKNKKNGDEVYHNFTDLIKLIQSHDFIFGSDSLPIHLSNFLNKPHFILYPKNGSKKFFTSFAIEQSCFCEISNNIQLVL